MAVHGKSGEDFPVTGGDWESPEVYKKHGHIALDCACVAGGRLAAFCVETEEVTYVEGLRQKG